MFASSLLGSVAGTVLGSMVAQHFFAHPAAAEASSPADGFDDQTADSEDADGDFGDDMDVEV